MDILIADDDSVTRSLLGRSLKKLGHKITECENGVEAFSMLEGPDHPRIAILDWMMPESNGIDVVKKVRKNHNLLSLYIIMLTSRDHQSDIIEGLKCGANDYITKPFFFEELQARIGVGVHLIELQNEISSLRELIPICAWCKKVKKDDDYWQQVEEYLKKKSNFEFTHGICPDCKKEQAKNIQLSMKKSV